MKSEAEIRRENIRARVRRNLTAAMINTSQLCALMKQQHDALAVLVLDPRHLAYLQETDPKLLGQIIEAIGEFKDDETEVSE